MPRVVAIAQIAKHTLHGAKNRSASIVDDVETMLQVPQRSCQNPAATNVHDLPQVCNKPPPH